MKIVSGFYVYRAYVSYKSHFSKSSSDISKYRFNLFKIPYDTFLNTNGKQFYDKIAKRLQKEDTVIGVLISAFMEDPNLWIGDIAEELNRYIDLKDERESRINNLSYIFRQNCVYLIEDGMKFDDGMGKFVLYRFLESNIELETFIIFKKIFNFTLDGVTNYDYLYKGKYVKYEFLLDINIDKYKKILKEVLMTFRD